MVSYKTVRYDTESGKVFVFVTRGKSAPFSKEEIEHFLSNTKDDSPRPTQAQRVAEELVEKFIENGQMEDVPSRPMFKIPKERQKLFLSDLRCGLEFCTRKYGASSEDIIQEAKAVFPSLNLEKLWEKKDGIKGQA